MEDKVKNKIISERLRPFYISSFFHGFILWFAIEKVFMSSIGFNPALITVIVVAMHISVLATEVPFGILADRWSRKGVLMLSLLFLSISTLLFGLSNSLPLYLIGTVIFGLYNAAFSGINESLVYDTLLEVNNSRKGYEKYLGRERIISGASLTVSSFAGGIVAANLGLRQTFYISIPFVILALLSLIKLKEPKNQTENETMFLVHHIKDTFKHVFQKGIVGWIVLSAISIGIMSKFLLETDQFWPLALSMPLFLYGPLNALLLFGYGVSGTLTNLITKNNKYLKYIILSFVIVFGLLIKNIYVVAISQFLIIALYGALLIIATGKLHDSLPSRLRAGSASVVSSLTSIIFIPTVLVFGKITDKYSVFTAAYMIIPISLIGLYSIFKITKTNS